jgi:ribosomal protein L7Ae-like RNA K-turn-binding protein
MKSAKIFLVAGERKLIPMEETKYVKEDDLQVLLASYPDLIPGDQIDVDNPRRWLLVARELSVPGDLEVSGRWSLDHLFLDQEGVPTFVECKRSSDTRGRREVVAQMLDYAANGTQYWKMDSLRQAAAETTQKKGLSLDEEILKLVDSEEISSIEEFWKLVENNLKSGKVRLIFVADSIPTELRRLVEFLNEQMVSVEVLAVEVKQFLGEGQKAIVPRVIGMTETARGIKQPTSHRTTTREEFLAKCTPAISNFYAQILDSAKEHNRQIYWGTKGFSVRIYLPEMEDYASIIYGYPPNILQIYFAHLPWQEEKISEIRKDLLAFKLFKEAPKTLTANLENKDLPKAGEACDLVLERIETIVKENAERT